MIQFEGMKSEEQKNTRFEQLPAGPYVGRIIDAKLEGEKPDQQLVLRLEVAEGEYAGYFGKRYQHDSEAGGQYSPRYKGDFKLRVPNDANPNARYPETDKRRFNDATWRIEQSNPGYVFQGDEKTLRGKMVGFSMQEDTYNGNTFTRIARLERVMDVKNGLIKVMPPRQRKQNTGSVEMPTGPVSGGDGFLPVENIEVPF